MLFSESPTISNVTDEATETYLNALIKATKLWKTARKVAEDFDETSKRLEAVVEKHRIKRMDKFPEKVANKFREVIKEYVIQNKVPNYQGLSKDGWAAVSDIFDALCNGNMFRNKKVDFSIAGHGSAYYRQYGTKEPEIFAQYFFLRTNNCTEALKVLKENTPELLNSLEELFTLYVKDLKNL